MLWDIFCKVIDNHGDIGVCWRLSVQLAARGQQVRLWVDDGSALGWMVPEGCAGVQVLLWTLNSPPTEPGEMVVEAFGCELPQAFQAAIAARTHAQGRQPAWINLEYLTAETFAERSHGLRSPVLAGPAAGLSKHFFYPGFTARTGGLLREADLMERHARFDRAAWLRRLGIQASQGSGDGTRLVSLFCYEPAALDQLLASWAREHGSTQLLVTAGRAADAVRAGLERITRSNPAWNEASRLSISWLPLLSQSEFDHLLWACDWNFVRGEDSLVRALWAGKPLVWHIYPQDDDAHHRKLAAFLDWLEAPPELRKFHGAWNGVISSLPALSLEPWRECLQQARSRLLAQDDLVTQLIRFISKEQDRP
jgi:uncharacterized repeat protein (TIGR03837 family)